MESILVYQQIFNLCLIRSSNNYWAWNFLNNINRMVSYRTACSNLCIFLASRQLKIRFNKPIRGCFQPGCLIRKSGNRFTIMHLFQEWEISRFRHFLKLYASNSWNDTTLPSTTSGTLHLLQNNLPFLSDHNDQQQRQL